MKLIITIEGENLLENAKREIVAEVVKHCKVQGEACKILGVNPKTLRKYLKLYGLELNSEGKRKSEFEKPTKKGIMKKIADYILKGEKSELGESNMIGSLTEKEIQQRRFLEKNELIKRNIQMCSLIAEKIRNHEILNEEERSFAKILYENKLMTAHGEMTELGRNCLYQ